MVTERKQWDTPKERKAFYARQYQLKMAKEDSPQGERWRELRRQASQRARDKKKAEAPPRPPKPPKAAKVHPSVQKRRFDTPIEPRKPSVIEVTPAKPVRPCTEAWIAQGGQVEVLPSKLGDKFGGLSELRVALF